MTRIIRDARVGIDEEVVYQQSIHVLITMVEYAG